MRVLNLFHHAAVNIIYFHVLSRDRVSDGAPILALLLRASLVLLNFTGGLLRLLSCIVDLGIAVFFVSVQLLHELLDVWDAIGTGVVLSRWDNSLVCVHIEYLVGWWDREDRDVERVSLQEVEGGKEEEAILKPGRTLGKWQA